MSRKQKQMVSGPVPRNTPFLGPWQWSSDVQTWAVYSQTPIMWTPLGPRVCVLLQKVSALTFQCFTDRY